jgi:hypothetical protein
MISDYQTLYNFWSLDKQILIAWVYGSTIAAYYLLQGGSFINTGCIIKVPF